MKLQFPFLHPSEESAISHVVAVLNDVLGQLQARLLRVTESTIVQITAPPSANVSFTVQHKLLGVPSFASVLGDSDLRIYADANDRREWSAKQIRIKCTAANASLVIKVER